MAFWDPIGWGDEGRKKIKSVLGPLMQVASTAASLGAFSGGGGAAKAPAKAGGAASAAGAAGTPGLAGGTAGGTAGAGADLKIGSGGRGLSVGEGATGYNILPKQIKTGNNFPLPDNFGSSFDVSSNLNMGTGLPGGSQGSLGFSKLPDIPAINDPLGRITTDQLGGTSIKKVQPPLGSTNLPEGQLPQTKRQLTQEVQSNVEFNQGKVEGDTPKTQPKTQPKPKKDFWDFLKTEKGKKLLEKTSEMGRKLTSLAAGSGAPKRLSKSKKEKIKKKARKKYRGRT